MASEPGTPGWRNRHKTALERVAIERVVRHLREEGRSVDDLWYPDLDRDDPRRLGRSTVDAAMTVDGREVGLDVTGVWTTARGSAMVRSSQVVVDLGVMLRRRLERSVMVFGVYDVDRLLLTRRRELVAAEAAVADLIVEVAARGPTKRATFEGDLLPDWLRSLQVAVPDGWPTTRIVMMPPADRATVVRGVLQRVREAKGRQLAPWGVGIVVLDYGLDETLEDVRRGFQRHATWPFWRAYWNDAARVHLVWDGPDPFDRGRSHHRGPQC